MEKEQTYCRHCYRSFIPKRNPRQRYCSEQACQNERKRDWRKQKRTLDDDYRENQQQANRQWQQRRPDYWRQYRKANPAYTQRNREQARLRRQQERQRQTPGLPESDASQFAKSDALIPMQTVLNPIKPGTYRLIPASRPEFAKSDALIVTIAVVAGV